MRKNKGADQLCGNRTAYQCLCFRYTDSKNREKFQASRLPLWLYSLVCVEPGRKPQEQVFSRHGSPTIFTSIYVNSHRDELMPSLWSKPDISPDKRIQQSISLNIVPIGITRKYLQKHNKTYHLGLAMGNTMITHQ